MKKVFIPVAVVAILGSMIAIAAGLIRKNRKVCI